MNAIPQSLIIGSPQNAEQIDAIWEAMLAFMQANGYTNANANVNASATSITCGISVSSPEGQTSVTQTFNGPRITISPLGANLGAGATQQFIGTVIGLDGQPVAGAVVGWNVGAGALGTITPTGLYTAPAVVAALHADTVAAVWTDGVQSAQASVIVNLTV
jgi:hypothetical protein